MPDLDYHPTSTFAVWENAFSPRNRGAVMVFPSCVLHRVSPCTKGTRKAMVAWTTGPQFR